MIINNGSALIRHSKTGRPLNQFKVTDLYSWADLYTSEVDQQVKILRAVSLIESEYLDGIKVRPNSKTVELVFRVILGLLLNPYRVMAIDQDIGDTSRPTRSTVFNRLELLGYIEIYQGFSTKGAEGAEGSKRGFVARPMGIKPTSKLISLIE